MKAITLRPYQDALISDLRASYRDGARRPLLVLPTGGGKTFVFSYIAGRSASVGKRSLILVHRQELLQQSRASLQALSIDPGVVAPRYPLELGRAVQVASVQTIVRRFRQLDAAGWAPDLIIVDEAHHATAGSWHKVLEHWPAARVLGVTATPCRMDGAGLSDVFDDLVVGPQIDDLIGAGFLAAPVVYAPPMVADMSGVRRRAGDFARDETAARMNKPSVTGDAAEHYGRICPRVPAIAFCVSVAHAEHVAESFVAAGWRAASVDGSMPDDVRRERIAELGAGKLDVLTSCDIISEGTDVPVVGAAILLRPTQSLGLYLQQVGRALRVCPGKERAVILDHVGNVARHGLPDEEREWTIEGKKRSARGKRDADEGPPVPTTCRRCFGQIRKPTPPSCPFCGETIPKQDRFSQLESVAGDLQRVTEDAAAAMRRARKREQAAASTLEDLVRLARSRGYRNPIAWAWKVHNARSSRTQHEDRT